MTGKTFAFIFARGGSKGLPRKNLLEINRIPLVGHCILIAKEIEDISDIYVSTDSAEISDIAIKYGAKVINRPLDLASDSSPEWDSWKHAIMHVVNTRGPFDRFISLPPTSPLRSQSDVVNCLDSLKAHVDAVVTMTPSQRSPWFNMVNRIDSHYLKLVNENLIISRRQDSPKCYDLTTVAYVSRPDFVLRASSIWDGRVVGVEIPRERAIDIDDVIDFEVATMLASRNLGVQE